MNKIVLFISCCLIWSVQAGSVPTFTKCESNDDECHKQATLQLIPYFADGIEAWGVEQMDPMKIDFVDASTPNLDFKVRNLIIKGMKNCEPKKIRRDSEKSKLFVEIICTAVLDADYVLNGNLLIFNLKGDGKVTVNLRNVLIKAVLDLVEKEHKDGEIYWSIKSWSHTFELKGKSDINFTNLIPHSAEIQSTINDLMKNKGNDIISELGPTFIQAAAGIVVKNVQQLLKRMPKKDLALS